MNYDFLQAPANLSAVTEDGEQIRVLFLKPKFEPALGKYQFFMFGVIDGQIREIENAKEVLCK